VLALVFVLIVFHVVWFRWMAEYLVQEQAPVKAGMIVVLGGDLRGDRILKGAALAQQGFAPQVLVSGGGNMYGLHESDLAVAWAVKHGYPESLFIKLPFPATSTRDEEEADSRELRKRNVRDFLLVTSTYHTRRAAATFRSVAPDLKFHTIGVPDAYFSADGWWHNREGEKTFVMEWAKTLADGLGF
jgi:uncharacterized SAM-binding protein YcdF (DUF218 family)